MDLLAQELVEFGSAGILLALFFGTFVSEDLACIAAGSLVAAGRVDPLSAVLACLVGIVVGDLVLFAAGRLFGQQILDSHIGSRFIAPETVKRASQWLSIRGSSAIFISRFVSGLRLPTYFLSGVLRLDAKRFCILITVAAAIWTPALVLGAAIWNMRVPLGAVGALVVFFLLFRFAFRMTDWKRRRILVGRIKRVWMWEFWPIWLFYVPVFFYVLYLVIRFRGLHFSAANPGMPASGFIGESKDAIYKLIAASPKSVEHLLRYAKISASSSMEERIAAAICFVDSNCLSYPIVVKPDAGERGDGVKIVHSDAELNESLRGFSKDFLIQEFAPGVEASVFYFRFPTESNGRIFSITEKIFAEVKGDGSSTIEELILRDPRAHIIARGYLKRNEAGLHSVPARDEKASLVEIGSHSKGAIFRDGWWLRSVELEASVDELARDIPGFYFGRFDVRAASFNELRKGRFRVIELNGVTSESTNIYDPKYSLTDAYRILFSQWQIAFEIGWANAARGVDRSSVSDLILLFLKSKRLA